ncbi:MAG: tetratricopeptide repeat protein [Phycisphaerales bacterium]|nr:tetratricopeptide repeat protein [Phycisphaerales bacterium]
MASTSTTSSAGERVVSLPVVTPGSAAGRTIRRSRSGRRRAIVLAIVQILMIAHFIQWRMTGRTISPVEPSESMEAVGHGIINAGAIFFALALLSTLLLGRWFCGWGCHVVMLQDLCGWIMKKCGIRPRPFRSRLLLYVPLILALYMFVWPAVYRWGVVPLAAKLSFIPDLAAPAPWHGVTWAVVTTDFWQTFPGVLIAVPFLLICGFATVYFLGAKGFCTYGCPYGGFFAPLEQYSSGRIRVTDACEHCGHCTAVCTSNVRVHEEVRAYGMVVDPGCMKCLDCVSVCPNDALYFGFGRPATRRGPINGAEPRPNFDLTIAEEIVFALLFFAVFLAYRGVYDAIPMLMAAGIAGCVTFIGWKAWRVVRDESESFHRVRLKYKGGLTRGGLVFLAVAGIVGLLTLHTGYIRTTQAAAERADRRVTVPRSNVFSGSPTTLSPEMRADADRAIAGYRRARFIGDGGHGLLPYPEASLRIAWLLACKHEFAEAETRLHEYTEKYGVHEGICLDIAALMRVQLKEREAAHYERQIIAERPNFVRVVDDLALWYEGLGDVGNAIAVCEEVLAAETLGAEERLYVMRRLSLLLLAGGRLDEGIALIERTIEIDDQNPAAFNQLARAHVQAGNAAAAITALEHAVALAPESPELRDELAGLLESLGRSAEAAEHAAEAARIRTGDGG